MAAVRPGRVGAMPLALAVISLILAAGASVALGQSPTPPVPTPTPCALAPSVGAGPSDAPGRCPALTPSATAAPASPSPPSGSSAPEGTPVLPTLPPLPSGLPTLPPGTLPLNHLVIWHRSSSTYNGDEANEEYVLVVDVQERLVDGAWQATGDWWLSGHGLQGRAMSDCDPVRQEAYTLGMLGPQSGTWLTPDQVAFAGYPGYGMLTYAPEATPSLIISLTVERRFTDACLDVDGAFELSFAWPLTCALDEQAGVPCEERWNGSNGEPLPAPHEIAYYGRYDFTSYVERTERPPGSPGMIVLTRDWLLGAIEGSH